MVVDKYCQIVEKDTASISVFWKVSHVLCLLTAAICSLLAVWNLMRITEIFGYNCILYANLTFTDKNSYESAGPIPDNYSFHNPLTIWGSETICSYTKCTYLFSMIVAMIMVAFFVIFPKGGYAKHRGIYTEAWKLIPWAIVASVIITICIVIAFLFTDHGITRFTDQMYARLNETSDCDNPESDCINDLNMFTLVYNPTTQNVERNIIIVKITSSAVLGAWTALFLTLLTRMVLGIDFRIVIYNLKPAGVKERSGSESSVSSTSFSDADNRIVPNKKIVKGQIHRSADRQSSSPKNESYL